MAESLWGRMKKRLNQPDEGIPTDALRPDLRVRKRHYVPHFFLILFLLTILDVKSERVTDYGLSRVERLWKGGSPFFSDLRYYHDDGVLSEALRVDQRDLRAAQYVVETYLEKLEREDDRPYAALITVAWDDYRFYLGKEVIVNLIFAFAFASLFYLKDRMKMAEELIEIQESKHVRLNLELASKVDESSRIIEKLNTLQDKLVDAEKLASIGRLSATLAHEIRNPLTIIKSSTDIIADDSSADNGSTAAVTVIREEVARMDRIISDLLNFARPKEPNLSPHDLASVVRHWLPPVVEELEKEKIQLVPQFEDFELRVLIDPDQLYQAFLNIMWNARDALVGTVNPHVFVRIEEAGLRHIRLSIQDTGVGMLPEVLAQIREPFYTTKTKGTGLGVSVSAQLVEGMGGRFEIDSKYEFGTTVSLYLRRADVPVEEPRRDADLAFLKTPRFKTPRLDLDKSGMTLPSIHLDDK